jgi:hypothetical protein
MHTPFIVFYLKWDFLKRWFKLYIWVKLAGFYVNYLNLVKFSHVQNAIQLRSQVLEQNIHRTGQYKLKIQLPFGVTLHAGYY